MNPNNRSDQDEEISKLDVTFDEPRPPLLKLLVGNSIRRPELLRISQECIEDTTNQDNQQRRDSDV